MELGLPVHGSKISSAEPLAKAPQALSATWALFLGRSPWAKATLPLVSLAHRLLNAIN